MHQTAEDHHETLTRQGVEAILTSAENRERVFVSSNDILQLSRQTAEVSRHFAEISRHFAESTFLKRNTGKGLKGVKKSVSYRKLL